MLLVSRSCAFIFFVLIATVVVAEDRFDSERAAHDLLDDSLAAEKREQLVEASLPHAAEVIREMAKEMPDDQAEEYRRIPWIWRVAIAAGKKNDEKILQTLLDVSLPKKEQPLADWQAVVIGGGIINGLSQAGELPAQRMQQLMYDNDEYQKRCWSRWQRTIELAAAMVDDEETPTGTRYDALRILGATSWKEYGQLISKYLTADANEELQMGAVSAAGDFDDDAAALALIAKMEGLTESNRSMVIDTLMHPASHLTILRSALKDGRVRQEWLNDEQQEKLKKP